MDRGLWTTSNVILYHFVESFFCFREAEADRQRFLEPNDTFAWNEFMNQNAAFMFLNSPTDKDEIENRNTLDYEPESPYREVPQEASNANKTDEPEPPLIAPTPSRRRTPGTPTAKRTPKKKASPKGAPGHSQVKKKEGKGNGKGKKKTKAMQDSNADEEPAFSSHIVSNS